MSNERARTVLHQRMDEAIGPEAADTLMEHLPPTGWADVATKHDLDSTSALLRAELHAEIAGLRTELHDGLAEVRTEMRDGLAEVRTEMHDGFARVDVRFAALVGTVAAGFESQRADLERGLRRIQASSIASAGIMVSLAVGLTQLLG